MCLPVSFGLRAFGAWDLFFFCPPSIETFIPGSFAQAQSSPTVAQVLFFRVRCYARRPAFNNFPTCFEPSPSWASRGRFIPFLPRQCDFSRLAVFRCPWRKTFLSLPLSFSDSCSFFFSVTFPGNFSSAARSSQDKWDPLQFTSTGYLP